MTLHDRLKYARESLDKSQKEMAELLGIGLRSWQVYEQGSSVPGGKVFESLVKLGFDANWLLTGEGSMKRGGTPQVKVDTGVYEPLPLNELPEVSMRFCLLPSMLDMTDEQFCSQIELDPIELAKIKAGRPLPGLVVRAVAYEYGIRMRWLQMGEIPFRNLSGKPDHFAQEMWGLIQQNFSNLKDQGKV